MAPTNLNPDHPKSSVFNGSWPSLLPVVGQCLLHCAALFALASVFLYLLLQIPGWRKRCVREELIPAQAIVPLGKDHSMIIAERGDTLDDVPFLEKK